MTLVPSRPLRIAVLGCGRLARRVHLPELVRSPDFVVAAVADASAEAAAGAADAAPGAVAFDDARTLLETVDLDAVLVAAPPAAHAELAIAAFRAGVAVYLEKPLAVTPDEGEAILAAWRASGRAGQIGFNYRFSPAMTEARRRIAAGELGDLVAVRSVFSSAPRAQSGWKRARASGGGALLDLGSHHLDLIPWLVDAAATEVSARISSRRFEDDTAAVSLRLGGEVLSESFFALGTRAEDRLEIYGAQGKLDIDRLRGTVELRPAQEDDGRADRFFREVSAGMQNVRTALRHTGEPSFALALGAFAGAVRGGNPASPDLSDGLRSLHLSDAAERSARSGGPVQLAPRPSQPIRTDPAGSTPDPGVPDEGASDRTDLSVILVTAGDWRRIRRTLEHLSLQTIRDRIEVVLVAPSESSLEGLPDDLVAGFASVQRVFCGPIDNVDVATAPGIRRSGSRVVATMEDHAFPEPGWAEAIVEAHRGSWGVVGSTFTNANPRSLLSWTNMLMAYGSWIVPIAGGEIGSVSRHNVSFKRSVLLAYDAELETLLGREGGLLPRLAVDGHRSFLAPGARMAHVNPSRLASTIRLRVDAGRLRAGMRASRGAWPAWRRAVYVLGGPLIPVLLFRGMFRDYFGGGQRDDLRARAIPALIIGTALDGLGQMVGFALGAGSTAQRLADFEFERARHLRRGDRHVLTG